ncbi:MAG: ABC transporter substrate-binding protein [Gammaproteobacteria bacterium]|nr:ABC transporter substrate-binding protein [Gammaproteobacteria bacterium]
MTVAARLGWLLVCGACLAACSRPPADIVVFAVATASTVLDPRLAGDAASERVNALLYDRLVVLDVQGRPHAAMASWEQLAPTRYRVILDPSRAAFWDGRRQPRAEDVAATYRTLLDRSLGSPHAGALAVIEDIEVIDDITLDFTLSRADPGFPARLTIGIAPTEHLSGGGLARAPLGSGPFRFDSWRDDGGLVLQRRRDGQRFALVPVPDPTMRVLKLLRGEAQLLQNDLPTELYDFLEKEPDIDIVQRPGTTFAYVGFNLADPVTGQDAVRRAIAHAIDRGAIIRHLFGTRARSAESVLPPMHWAGADLESLPYDPDRARALLRSAGFGPDNPLTISYKTSTDPFRLRIAHVFQDQLADVGIRLQIASYDWGTFFGDIKAGRFQMYSLAWVGINSPDILRYAFHSTSLPPAGANRGRLVDPELDRLIEQGGLADADEAASLYRAAQARIHDSLVYVPLWYEHNVSASRGLVGYHPGHDGNYLALTQTERRHAEREISR